MPRKKNPLHRAGEWLLGKEIDEEYEPDTPAKAADFEKARKGELPPLGEHLERLESATRAQMEEPAKSSVLAAISRAKGLLYSLPLPAGLPLEASIVGRAQLLAWETMKIGSESTAWNFEFGVNGDRIYKQKRAVEASKRGGKQREAEVSERDLLIANRINGYLEQGLDYSMAIQRVHKNWNSTMWGDEITLGSLRNRFPKKNFHVPP